MAALRYILLAAAITLTLVLLAHLVLPARAPIPRRTGRRGGLGIAALTAVYAVAAFFSLGSARDPQRFCSFEAGESAVLALERETAIAAVWYYPGLSTGEYTLAYSADGVTFTPAGTMPQGYADLFKWLQPQPVDAAPATAAYVRITASAHMELGEFALYDLQGERIGVRDIAGPASADALCDEADTVPAASTYYNSTYFDEIYHARTAYEQLRGVYPYEVSHPPLGKEILSLGIALFGMMPFGWRCMGALFGVAMLPLMWDLLRRMFRPVRRGAAGVRLHAPDADAHRDDRQLRSLFHPAHVPVFVPVLHRGQAAPSRRLRRHVRHRRGHEVDVSLCRGGPRRALGAALDLCRRAGAPRR